MGFLGRVSARFHPWAEAAETVGGVCTSDSAPAMPLPCCPAGRAMCLRSPTQVPDIPRRRH